MQRKFERLEGEKLFILVVVVEQFLVYYYYFHQSIIMLSSSILVHRNSNVNNQRCTFFLGVFFRVLTKIKEKKTFFPYNFIFVGAYGALKNNSELK